MKTLFLTSVFLVAIINYTLAQTSKKEFIITKPELTVDNESKAVKNFERSYPSVMGEKWRSADGNYFVTFKDGDIKNKISYTREGQLDYILKLYQENNLPRDIRAAVKGIYYDYRITGVQELQIKNKMIYLIKMKDAITWKTVRVCNGDVEEIENVVISQ